MRSWLAPITLASLALLVLQAVFGALLVSDLPVPEGSPLWFVASTLLTATLLLALARSVPWSPSRALVLFGVWGALLANNLLEAAFFGLDIPEGALPRMLASQLLVAGGTALVVHRLAGRPGPAGNEWPKSRPLPTWLGRVLVTDLAYVVAYLSAGLAVYPFVEHFYAERSLPPMSQVFAMQLFRGLVFTGVVALLVRQLTGSRTRIALLSGLALSVLGGVGPLLLPNPFMPVEVRLAHLVEVGLSNLAFGWIAARLLGAPCGTTPGGSDACATPQRTGV